MLYDDRTGSSASIGLRLSILSKADPETVARYSFFIAICNRFRVLGNGAAAVEMCHQTAIFGRIMATPASHRMCRKSNKNVRRITIRQTDTVLETGIVGSNPALALDMVDERSQFRQDLRALWIVQIKTSACCRVLFQNYFQTS